MSNPSNTVRASDREGGYQQTSSRMVASSYILLYLELAECVKQAKKPFINQDSLTRAEAQSRSSFQAIRISIIFGISKTSFFHSKATGCKKVTDSSSLAMRRTSLIKDLCY